MPPWQVFDLPLVGLDGRSAPPRAQGALELQNYELIGSAPDRLRLVQRRGTVTHTTLAAGISGLTVYNGRPLAICTDAHLRRYGSAAGWSASLGRPCVCHVERGPFASSFGRSRYADSTTASDATVLLSWSDDRWNERPRWVALDGLTVVASGQVADLGLAAYGPIRWAPDGRGVFCGGSNEAAVVSLSLYGISYSPSTGATLYATGHSVAGAGATPDFRLIDAPPYDCDAIAGHDWIAVARAAMTQLLGATIRFTTYRTTPAWAHIQSTVVDTGIGAGATNNDQVVVAISIEPTSRRVAILYGNTGSAAPAWSGFLHLWTATVSADGSTVSDVTATANVLAIGAAQVEHVAVAQLSATDTYVAATIANVGADPERRQFTWRRTGGAQRYRDMLAVSGKPIVRSATDIWQPVTHHYTRGGAGTSGLDSVWALLPLGDGTGGGDDAGMYALALRGMAFGPDRAGSVGRTSGVIVPQLVRARELETGGATEATTGVYTRTAQASSVCALRLDWSWSWATRTAQLGSYLLLPGGSPMLYDGANLVEAGFAWRPEYPLSTAAVGAGITCQIAQTYAWRDAVGAFHLSEPSPTQTLAALVLPYTHGPYNLTLTRRAVATHRLTTLVWRSENAGIVLHRVSDGDTIPYPIVGASTPSVLAGVADAIVDANLATRETIYTSEGELSRVAPPSARFVHAHGGRLWLADCEVSDEVWFSHARPAEAEPASDQIGPAWTLGNVVKVGAPARALGTITESLVVLCDRGVYLVSGDGPNRSGVGAFSVQRRDADVGVLRPASVVSAPDGVYFVSERGLYRLGLDMALVPIGMPVQSLLDADSDLRSPVVVPSRHQIIWTRPNSTDLIVYHWDSGQWARWVLAIVGQAPPGVRALAAGAEGAMWLAVSASPMQLREQVSGSVADDGLMPPAILQTPWLHMGGITGWQRTRRVGVVGQLGASALVANWRSGYASSGVAAASWTLPAGSRGANIHAPAGAGRSPAFSLHLTVTQPLADLPHELWGLSVEVAIMGGVGRRPITEKR